MPLCSIRQTIPFRAIAEAIRSRKDLLSLWTLDTESNEDLEASEAAKWRQSTSDSFRQWHHIRHSTLPVVTKSAAKCDLCTIILNATHGMSVLAHTEDTKKSVLEVPGRHPGHHIWLCIPGVSLDLKLEVYYGDQSGPDMEGDSRLFLVRTSLESPFAGITAVHLANTNPLHQSNLETIKAWMNACSREHSDCTRDEVLLPTRVIDMMTLPSCDDLVNVADEEAAWRELFRASKCRLVETMPAQAGEYATLSYRWGASLPYTTTSKNIKQHLAGLEFDHLPRTLQDALMLARYLGFRYIWIDCLCIIQDNEEDWAREAASMADIYSNSALCIAASRSSNCDEGFLQTREIGHWTHLHFADKEGQYSLYVYDDPVWFGLISREWRPEEQPLGARAWAYQERLLANRLLSITSDGCTWTCSLVSSREDGVTWRTSKNLLNEVANSLRSETGWAEVQTIRSDETAHLSVSWWQLIEEYQRLLLTDVTDKLPALSGIMYRLQKATGDVCYAGLWRKHFLRGLLWRASEPDPRRCEKWLAPSWSFAALAGSVQYHVARESLTFLMKLEECKLEPLNTNNPLGKLKAGFAQLSCPVIPLFIVRFNGQKSGHGYSAADRFEGTTTLHDDSDIAIWFDDVSDFQRLKVAHTPRMGDDDGVVICEGLMVTTQYAIIVQALDAECTRYTRLGVAFLRHVSSRRPCKYPEPRSILLL